MINQNETENKNNKKKKINLFIKKINFTHNKINEKIHY